MMEKWEVTETGTLGTLAFLTFFFLFFDGIDDDNKQVTVSHFQGCKGAKGARLPITLSNWIIVKLVSCTGRS
jgi:hypothetical protein